MIIYMWEWLFLFIYLHHQQEELLPLQGGEEEEEDHQQGEEEGEGVHRHRWGKGEGVRMTLKKTFWCDSNDDDCYAFFLFYNLVKRCWWVDLINCFLYKIKDKKYIIKYIKNL